MATNTFVTSDSHLFHLNIIRYANRPFSGLDEMHSVLIERWNELVKPEDVVYHLGDVSLCRKDARARLQAIIGSLNGEKHLIKGNHDDFSTGYYLQSGFKTVSGVKLFDGKVLSHIPRGEGSAKRARRLESYLGEHPKVKHIVHGHTHDAFALDKEKPNHFNVCVEAHDYYPVSWDVVKKYLK